MAYSTPLIASAPITPDGCWADYRTHRDLTRDRPCLFLDRDGVLIEDTGYPHVPADVVVIAETFEAVAAAQRRGAVVGIVSNQSGVGRGYFGWDAFAAVQAVIDARLATLGARLDFVLACPHHPDAPLPLLRADHPWRKPRPGMLIAVRDTLGVDIGRSVMLGDRMSDMAAAKETGVTGRWLVRSSPSEAFDHEGIRHVGRDDLWKDVESLFAQPRTVRG